MRAQPPRHDLVTICGSRLTPTDVGGHGERVRRGIVGVIVITAAAGGLGVVVPPPAAGSCVGPVLGVGPTAVVGEPPSPGPVLARGAEILVTGAYFHRGCEDTSTAGPGCSGPTAAPADPESPLTEVQLRLQQGATSWVLGTGSATGPTYAISWRWRLPPDAEPGPAELRAESTSLPVTIG